MSTLRALAPLAPAPPKPQPLQRFRVTFYDLPAELRIEIYRLALESVVIHIKPLGTPDNLTAPHSLTRTSRQVRNEVLPLMHAICPIRSTVQDLNFDGLLAWMARVPPHEESNLAKNRDLRIYLITQASNQPYRSISSLRKWLHMRSDRHRPHPDWQYTGPQPGNKICADLRRRCKRMTEYGRQREMVRILKGINIPPPSGLLRSDGEESSSSSASQALSTPTQHLPSR